MSTDDSHFIGQIPHTLEYEIPLIIIPDVVYALTSSNVEFYFSRRTQKYVFLSVVLNCDYMSHRYISQMLSPFIFKENASLAL